MRHPIVVRALAWPFVGLRLLVLACICSLAGCAAASLLQSSPGSDTTAIKPGAQRQLVDEVLGAPLRQWQTAADITYCLYEFDGGLRPNVWGAIGMAVSDVGTMGIIELAEKNRQGGCPFRGCGRERARMIVSYGADGRVISTFRETDELPSDGRREPR